MATPNRPSVEEKASVTQSLCRAIYETVLEMGDEGAPCTPMVIAFENRGISQAFYQGLEDGLIRLGVLSKKGHTLFIASKELAAKYGLVR